MLNKLACDLSVYTYISILAALQRDYNLGENKKGLSVKNYEKSREVTPSGFKPETF
jgi:hypothetical protein